MNIVIIEQNKIYRESLKTALSQVKGFDVVFETDNGSFPETLKHVQVNLILIDYDFGEEKCNETINIAYSIWPAVSFLFLTNYKEECNFDNIKISAAILKNSSKKEFECRIRELVGTQISVQLHL
jgi:DNA-binding NarL/FixJ family response regulator